MAKSSSKVSALGKEETDFYTRIEGELCIERLLVYLSANITEDNFCLWLMLGFS
jgi:hypothetical protein